MTNCPRDSTRVSTEAFCRSAAPPSAPDNTKLISAYDRTRESISLARACSLNNSPVGEVVDSTAESRAAGVPVPASTIIQLRSRLANCWRPKRCVDDILGEGKEACGKLSMQTYYTIAAVGIRKFPKLPATVQYASQQLAYCTVAGGVYQAIGAELSNIASNEFRDRDALVNKELRAPGGIGDRGSHRVDADVVIYRCYNFLHINGTIHCMLTQTIG